MILNEIITIKQEASENKLEFLNAIESLEKRGYKTVSSHCYNNEKKLAEVILLREAELILNSNDIVNEANKFIGLN